MPDTKTLKPALLVVDMRLGFDKSTRTTYMCKSGRSAANVQRALLAAAKAWHDKNNDRERLFSFKSVNGPCAVDVSEIVSIGIDDPFGPGGDYTRAWNTWSAEEQGRLVAIHEGAKAKEQNLRTELSVPGPGGKTHKIAE